MILVSLHGLVNRKQPRIFLVTSNTEAFCLNEIKTTFGLATENVADPWALLEKFKDEVAGAIVYDPNMMQTINVAKVLAGV